MAETTHAVLKQTKTEDGDVYNADLSLMVVREDFSSYESNLIRASVLKEGALSFFSDMAESHIFFYPDQLPHLRELLERAEKQAASAPLDTGAEQ